MVRGRTGLGYICVERGEIEVRKEIDQARWISALQKEVVQEV